jgi:hypothetical protein
MKLPDSVKGVLHWLSKMRPRDAKIMKDFIEELQEKLKRYEEAGHVDQIPLFKGGQSDS